MAVEITPVVTPAGVAPRYSGKAVLALPAGLLAVFVPAPFGTIVAVFAIVVAILSRRELKRDDTLRGARLSLLGFLLGAGVVLFQLLPWLMTAWFLTVGRLTS
jgi:hypothetical protein